jgi:hypothetical protein
MRSSPRSRPQVGALFTAHRVMPTTPLASPSAWRRAQAEDIGGYVHNRGYRDELAQGRSRSPSGGREWIGKLKKVLVAPAVMSGDRIVRPGFANLPRNDTEAKVNQGVSLGGEAACHESASFKRVRRLAHTNVWVHTTNARHTSTNVG